MDKETLPEERFLREVLHIENSNFFSDGKSRRLWFWNFFLVEASAI